jgi:hypothetical protein
MTSLDMGPDQPPVLRIDSTGLLGNGAKEGALMVVLTNGAPP